MKAIWVIVLLLLPLSMLPAEDQDPEGDEKILETIRKIQEEEEKEKEYHGDEEDDDGCSGCSLFFDGCGDGCGEFGGELFWNYMLYVSFAPYPYAPSVDFYFSELDYRESAEQKITSFQASADLSTHFDGTYGNTNRLTAQLSALQLNVFNQTTFATSVSLSNLSVNLGVSLLIRNFDLTGFAGTYVITTTGTFKVSAGLSSRIFFPGRVYLDLYGLYAFLSENAGILHLMGSLNFSIWRFSIGAGYNYNNFVGDVYAGPCLKVSFWL
jgi:hypothetical protein